MLPDRAAGGDSEFPVEGRAGAVVDAHRFGDIALGGEGVHEQGAGLLPEQVLVTYCQGGVRAADAALALRIAGYPRVRVYDGSWAEWGNDPALPIEAGATMAAA